MYFPGIEPDVDWDLGAFTGHLANTTALVWAPNVEAVALQRYCHDSCLSVVGGRRCRRVCAVGQENYCRQVTRREFSRVV